MCHVIEVLTPSIPFSYDDFRFHWAYCQLETLRQCPLRYVSSTLDELPKTLDETYERILRGIPEKMQKDAHRIFQWLTVSSWPLRVEEVAEVFAINFDEEMSGIPTFEPCWRDANAETAVLSACSTLITIVDSRWDGKIVQFSHFSVKEYLTSDRIANAEHVSHFHIHPKLAHTLLTKACLSVLFQLDYGMDKAKVESFPLAKYAAQSWVDHARFEDVSSCIRDGMDLLFDKDKPHFAIWVRSYNPDEYSDALFYPACPEQPDAVPLYYAALCGFRGLVERLLTAHPQDLNAEGGDWGSPLNAALGKGHLDIAQYLLDCGADGGNRGNVDRTGLYIASSRGYADVVRSLADRGADLDTICEDYSDIYLDDVKWTSLHLAIYKKHRDIAILLLERGANTEILSSFGQTALYIASSHGYTDGVRSLIDHGADVNAICEDYDEHGNNVKQTPLHVAIYKERRDVAQLLLERGANTEILSSFSQTALYMASSRGYVDGVWSLIDHGADPNMICKDYDEHGDNVEWTPFHVAIYKERRNIMILLLKRGADTETRSSRDETALYMASHCECADIVRQLISHGADLNAVCEDFDVYYGDVKWTPLQVAICKGTRQISRTLLEYGANPNKLDNWDVTALHLASRSGEITDVESLLEYGANVEVRDRDGWTPLHEAAYHLNLEVLVALLNRGADPHAQINNGETPIQLASAPHSRISKEDQAQILRSLSECTSETLTM